MRYKNSVVGIAWSLILPLIQVSVQTVALRVILHTGPANLGSYLFCAIVPWTFFNSALLDASSSVIEQYVLVEVYFPREISVISAVIANFVNFGIVLGAFVIFRWVFGTILYHSWPGLPPASIFWLPVVMFIELMLVLGLSFFFAALNVFVEDVKFMLTAAMSAIYYLLPIMYFSENLGATTQIPSLKFHWLAFHSRGTGLVWTGVTIPGISVRWWVYHLYLANPLAWIITAFKQMFFIRADIAPRGAKSIMSAPFDWRYMLIAFAMSLIVCVLGYMFFNTRKWKFAERP